MKTVLGENKYVVAERGSLTFEDGPTRVTVNSDQFFHKLKDLDEKVHYTLRHPETKTHFVHGACIEVVIDHETKEPLIKIRDSDGNEVVLGIGNWQELILNVEDIHLNSSYTIIDFLRQVL